MAYRADTYENNYGDPYFDDMTYDDSELDIPAFEDCPFDSPDSDPDNEYNWHDALMDELEEFDWEALERQRKKEEAQLDAEEDAMVNAWDGDEPKFVSMRRAAIMKRHR